MSLMNPVFVHKVTVKEIKHGSYQEVAIGLPGYGSQLPFVTLGMFLLCQFPAFKMKGLTFSLIAD